MRTVPWTAAGVALLLVALVLPAAQPARKPSEAETRAAELRALDAQMERQQRQVRKDAEEIERQNKALRAAELAVSRASGDLSSLKAQRAERMAARQLLVDERSRRQAEKEATEADLAGQLRAAYFMGHDETLKLLLNQRSPAEVGRNLTYYGYLGRLRAGQINLITENIARIDELAVKIDEEDARLADNMVQQRKKLDEREEAKKQRDAELAALRREAGSRADELKRMRVQRQNLEELVKKLEREAQAARAVPFDPDKPFSQRVGKLSWPVAGRIVANFGAKLGPDLISDGVDIDAPRGTEVRAVHEGMVVLSDYLTGLGNTIVLRHGDDYLSVYYHMEELFKAKDAKVAAGEKIGTVGDTGGRKTPGLHFEIRHNSRPVDIRTWFRTPAPPAN